MTPTELTAYIGIHSRRELVISYHEVTEESPTLITAVMPSARSHRRYSDVESVSSALWRKYSRGRLKLFQCKYYPPKLPAYSCVRPQVAAGTSTKDRLQDSRDEEEAVFVAERSLVENPTRMLTCSRAEQ